MQPSRGQAGRRGVSATRRRCNLSVQSERGEGHSLPAFEHCQVAPGSRQGLQCARRGSRSQSPPQPAGPRPSRLVTRHPASPAHARALHGTALAPVVPLSDTGMHDAGSAWRGRRGRARTRAGSQVASSRPSTMKRVMARTAKPALPAAASMAMLRRGGPGAAVALQLSRSFFASHAAGPVAEHARFDYCYLQTDDEACTSSCDR